MEKLTGKLALAEVKRLERAGLQEAGCGERVEAIMEKPIGTSEAIALAEIIRAAWEQKLVSWYDEDRDAPSTGVAHALVRGPEDLEPNAEQADGVDPRDLWLHVIRQGDAADLVSPVTEIMQRAIEGSFSIEMWE